MELPHMGKHCSKNDCNKLDFLPIRCDACQETFCEEHYSYLGHNCQNAYKKNNQVPVCPLCNIPIPVRKDQHPDIVVGAHLDNDCQSDPAKDRRKVFTNKCSVKRCKNKEVIPVLCNQCSLNFCLKHRHPTDHNCGTQPGMVQGIHGNISEDEALAKALALSMQDGKKTDKQRQEELDFALAKQLQASESSRATVGPGSRNSPRNRCNVS